MVAVVATANHFVIDVVAGVALVLVGYYLALRLERWRGQHETHSTEKDRTHDETQPHPLSAAGV
jgi:hypothetical protein